MAASTPTYRTDHAADPELYGRLMRERYGSLGRVMAESRRLPAPAESTRMPIQPDPDAARHRADLEAALDKADADRHRTTVLTKDTGRTPPFPGATWCDSCTSWCSPIGICRCNNR